MSPQPTQGRKKASLSLDRLASVWYRNFVDSTANHCGVLVLATLAVYRPCRFAPDDGHFLYLLTTTPFNAPSSDEHEFNSKILN